MQPAHASLDAAIASDDPAFVLSGAPAYIELLPIATYACEANGRLRWFNSRAAALWGRSPEIGDDTERFCGAFKVFGLDGRPIARDESAMAEALRTGTTVTGRECTIERPDGSQIAAMIHSNPIKDFGGNVIGAITCVHDIGDTRREDRAIRESERQLREVLQALPAAIYTTDAAGRITFYNEAAVELSGRRPELGTDSWCVTWRLYHPDGTPMPHDECPMAVTLRDDIAVRGYEAVAERPDGVRIPFIPYPTPLHDASGAMVGAVNMLVDVSHRKDAETQQRLLFAELNHRIKNNMQILQALLTAELRKATSAEVKSAMTGAIQRVSAMASAQNVLYRADRAGTFEIQEFIDMVLAGTRIAVPDGIAIACDNVAAGELANDAAVPLALVLNELISNAVKHGMAGRDTGRITVALTREDDALALSVEDDGPGFLLGQVRGTRSGLDMVAGLARQLNGSFVVERGNGARCVLRFADRQHPHH